MEWIIYYETKGQRHARLTARYFGIAPKTFYQWSNRFDESNLRTLAERSCAPINRRTRQYTPLQYARVIKLRREHIRWGKLKLLKIYQNEFPQDKTISNWKIQCIIQSSGLYYHLVKQAGINRKRVLSVKRKRITDLTKKPRQGFLVCVDTVVWYIGGQKWYILTAIDRYSKLAFGRMYTTHSSKNAQDFLHRLCYLLDGKIENVRTDNGSEFKLHFDTALTKLNIPHYHSRVKTPKDEWLIEYNFKRPHQTLGYLPPINFHFKYHKVLPMYSSNTGYV